MEMMRLKAGCEVGIEQEMAPKALNYRPALICLKSQQCVGGTPRDRAVNSLRRTEMTVPENILGISKGKLRF